MSINNPRPYIHIAVSQPDIETICRRIKSKELILTPKFQIQREPHLWGVHQQSRLIESLLMGLPVPPVFVARDSSGVASVIDGVQRLSTIDDFIDSKFALRGLQYRPDIEGRTFKDLSPLEQRAFLQAQLVVHAVPTDTSWGEEICTILSERLNSTSR